MQVILFLIFAPLISIWRGYVFSVMWLWFIVPVFAAPPLRIPYAIGLALVIGMLTHQTRKTEDDPSMAHIMIVGALAPLVMLGVAWIVKLFV